MSSKLRSWKRPFEEYLKATIAPKIGFDEFYGDSLTMGFLDHILDMVRDCRRDAYIGGFYDGASEVVKEDPLLTVDPVVNKITAERAFLKWE